MTASTTGARASRRAAARQAAAEPPVQQAQAPDVIEVLADVTDDEIDEAFGPEDAQSVAASTAPQNPTPVSSATSQAVAPVRATSAQHGAIALPQVDLTREIGIGDLVIPKLRLVQAMSKANTLFATSRGSDGVGMGNWTISTQNKDLGQTVWFVPCDMRKSRALFVQGQGLMCRSFDMLHGEGDPGGDCLGTAEERLTMPSDQVGCPLRLWNDKIPPKCGVTYNYPGYLIEDIEHPEKPVQVMLQLRSASTQIAKMINTIVINEGGGVWSSVILEFGVESRSNTKGTFFVPTVDFYDTTDAPEFARLKRRADSMARQMGGVDLRNSIENDPE